MAMNILRVTFVGMGMHRTEAEATPKLAGNPRGADYEDDATITNVPITSGSFTYMDRVFHNKLNISSEKFISGFDISNYQNNCTEFDGHEVVDEFEYVSYNSDFLQQLVRTASELREAFHALMKHVMRFTCTANTATGYDVITMAKAYVEKCKEFVTKLNSSMLSQNTAEVEGTVILDPMLYESSIEHTQSVIEAVKHLTEIIAGQAKIDALNHTISANFEAMCFTNQTAVLEINVEEQKKVIKVLTKCIETTASMSKYKEEHDFLNFLLSSHISHLLDVRYWEHLMHDYNDTLQMYETKLSELRRSQFILYTVKPIIMVAVLIVGTAGNALLLSIFIRHKETRTLPNSMLINLTVVDCISLVINLLLEYLRLIMHWPFGLFGCRIFFYTRYVFIGVSIYSVVMLSVQRFMAVKDLSLKATCHLRRKASYVVIITAVWALGFILAVPHASIAIIERGLCYELSFQHFGAVSTADLTVFCIVPVILVAAFSVTAASRIRKSVSSIPGEGTGQEHMRHNRMVSATVLVALVVLFVVSYTPDFLYKFLILEIGIVTPPWEFLLVNTITYFLRFVNCCLNPLVLFVMSKRYRGYMKECIVCVDRKALVRSKSEDTMQTSL
jgi:hypothetical protein